MISSADKQNLISRRELVVLQCLKEKGAVSKERSTTEVNEISVTTGIRDNDEVLRALYTLEGKSLVQPEPEGDFTSNSWKITDTGILALGMVPF